MIAVDTNILVRVLTKDDGIQATRALEVLRTGPIWVPKTVFLETEWVLRGAYKLSPQIIHASLARLASTEGITIEDAASIGRALTLLSEGMDLADALHLSSSAKASELVTFDRSFAKHAGSFDATPPVRLLPTR